MALRVLVVRPSSLGDVVHALPVVADIARAHPDATIDWLAEEAFAPVVALNPRVDGIVAVALRRWRHRMASPGTWREMERFRRALRRAPYDAVLDLQEQVKGALMARLARGPVHGFDRDTVRERASTWLHDRHHRADRGSHFDVRCRALAGAALGYQPEGPPTYGLRAPALPDVLLPQGRYAVIVHVTSRDDKRWPDAKWHEVIGGLERAGIEVLLPWGSDEERVRSEALARGHALARVPPRMALAPLAAVLARASIVIGVDTGLVHLAAALRTPTIAIFTTTDARLAGVALTGPHATDLGGERGLVTAAEVMEAAGALLARAPVC